MLEKWEAIMTSHGRAQPEYEMDAVKDSLLQNNQERKKKEDLNH